jgi:murein DD-endopeptidase MepM/ murein hydrolase activator NlpD
MRPAPRTRILLAALAATCALAGVAPAPAPAQDEGDQQIDVDALRHEYEELAGDEADLLVAYDQATARLAELLPQLEAAKAEVDEANRALWDAQVALDEARVRQEAARADLEEARARVADTVARLRRYAVEAYMGDGSTDVDVSIEMLTGEDESLVRHGYRTSVGDQQARLVDELEDARRDRASATRAARRSTNAAEDLRDQIEDLRSLATAALAEVQRLTQEAASERMRQEVLLADVRSRKVSIEARIVGLEKAADGIAQILSTYQRDDDDWLAGSVDVDMPHASAEIGSEFGMRHHPILGITRLHAGADIGAPAGSEVLAAADGVVLVAGPRGGYGNTVVIAHANSLGTVYAHNSSIDVQVGDIVEQGDVIARVGSTGLSTGPHIHWETRIKGIPVNPRNFLPPPDGTGVEGPDPDEQPGG